METLISRYRQVIAATVYSVAAMVSFALALAVDDHGFSAAQLWTLRLPVAALLVIRLISHRLHRLTTSRWRYTSTHDVVRLVSSTTIGTVVFAGVSLTGLVGPMLPPMVFALEWLLTIFFTASAWISYRLIFEHFRQRGDPPGEPKRAIIVGAGEAGTLLAREILRAPTGLALVGFVDDDPLKRSTHIHGVRVLGTSEELPEIVADHGVDRVVIAIPSAEPSDLRRVVEACEGTDVEYRVLPGMVEALKGRVSVRQLRKVTIEDLLGRPPVSVELPEFSEQIADSVVLVTGAGGSIGSELARQIAANAPARLVILDQAESDLFFIELELRERYPGLPIVAVVADICDAGHIEDLIRDESVTHVFHAAAYKHVPLMEENVAEAVKNNVGGTRNLLESAGRCGLQSFVLVSTDKAVRPANVMGATKRVCELLMLSAALRYSDTAFTAVRFGNVLGSNGSVVQIFRRQLERGRLTVTHPDITRYFMTVGEAVRLILVASLLDEARGRIAMLDMGEPVRIMDLARNMIRLSGLEEGRDVEIDVTGLRKGEKLHEELVAPFESASPTRNGKIHIVCTLAGGADFDDCCRRLIALAHARDVDGARELLSELVASSDVPSAALAVGMNGRSAVGRLPLDSEPEVAHEAATRS